MKVVRRFYDPLEMYNFSLSKCSDLTGWQRARGFPSRIGAGYYPSFISCYL